MGSCGSPESQQENNLKYSPSHVLSCHEFSCSTPSHRWLQSHFSSAVSILWGEAGRMLPHCNNSLKLNLLAFPDAQANASPAGRALALAQPVPGSSLSQQLIQDFVSPLLPPRPVHALGPTHSWEHSSVQGYLPGHTGWFPGFQGQQVP